jgi:hypothetical protein
MFSNIKTARLLGWTSLAVGMTELVATEFVEDELGVRGHKTLLRVFGARELAAGLVILAQPGLNRSVVSGLWARVAGDGLDILALGEAATTSRNPVGFSRIFVTVLAITGLDLMVALRANRNLCHATRVAREARERVTRTAAEPNRAQGMRHSSGANTVTAATGDAARSVVESAGR